MKTAQMSSKVFTYMFIIIIVALILLFGIRAFISTHSRSNEALLLQFETKLKTDVEAIGKEYGSLSVKTYAMPPGYDEICFVDLKNVNSSDILNHPIIKDSVEGGIEQNIFLFDGSEFKAIFIEDMELFGYPYFFCSEARRTIKLSIAGTGRAAVIKTPPVQKHCENANKTGLCAGLDIFFEGYRQDCCDHFGECCP